MSLANHLEALRAEHGRIEEAIDELARSPSADDLEIAELKKKKLALKDRIAGYEAETRH